MFCKNCGAPLEESNKFCASCGTPVEFEPKDAEIVEDEQISDQTGEEINEQSDDGAEKSTENKINYAMPVQSNNVNTDKKSKLVAGLFGIFLGFLGVHNFYLGYNGRGLAQLLLTVIGSCCTLGITAFAAWLWGLIEGIMILCGNINTDASGNELGE